MTFLLHHAAEERGFAHPDHLLDQLTSSQVTDLAAYYHIKAQGDDYWRQPAMMTAGQIKGVIGQIKHKRQQAKEAKAKKRNGKRSNP